MKNSQTSSPQQAAVDGHNREPKATENPTRWLDVPQQRVWRSFLGGTTTLMEVLDRDLREHHDLSMNEYEILVRLSEKDGGSIRMSALAQHVSLSRSRLTHTIARLESLGVVRRFQCAEDGRGISAEITEQGRDILAHAAPTHVHGVRSYLFDQATEEELESLGALMERVRVNLDGIRF